MRINIESNIGHIVKMKATNPLHYTDEPRQAPDDDISSSFADVLKKAIGNVNDLQVESEGLSQKMIYEPESVDIHTVMIAAQKAEIALNFTKAIRDDAIRSFRELMNLR
ncbi:MAG: flagellar hook-basal body complex protein FliE [Spirochaetes bacterium]|jgi:flagellar hook-basal body complex protein FliE|nr:flagellar hook-basal body complex protein FliE [Spirochaetota bacterium]